MARAGWRIAESEVQRMNKSRSGPKLSEAEQISALVGDIYDAALEPAKWVEVLEACAHFNQGTAASVFAKNVDQQGGTVFYQHGIDPEYASLYFNKYVKLDPSTSSQLLAQVGDIISTESYMTHDELRETRFYREWAQPQGWVDGVTAILQKAPLAVAMFTVFRHARDGVADDEMRRRMRLLIPHVRRAVLIGRLLDAKQSEVAAFADTLDKLTAGIFLVDASGHLAHSNAAAQSLLSAGDLLSAVGSRIVTDDFAANALLQDAIMSARDGDGAIGAKGVALPLTTRHGDDYVAHVLPLTSGTRRQAGRSCSAVAALFVSKVGHHTPSASEVIAARYKLTPTELRVLLAIVDVGGVPDVADLLGISPTTVRTHLGSVYAKTGVNRQADLVKLVMHFTSPIR
jgi:DNA-binding CsgD family transcriptional regulator